MRLIRVCREAGALVLGGQRDVRRVHLGAGVFISTMGIATSF
jgi:hypothetical protein